MLAEVFAFEWCDCLWESGFSVVSLHATKADAFRAMTTEANREAQKMRDDLLRYGNERGRKLMDSQAWRVRRYPITPPNYYSATLARLKDDEAQE